MGEVVAPGDESDDSSKEHFGPESDQNASSEAAKELGRRGGLKGGRSRADKMSPEERSEQARKAGQARWDKKRKAKNSDEISISPLEESDAEKPKIDPGNTLPVAKFKGVLPLMGLEIPCYVLEDGQRVIGRTSATEALTGIKGGGDLEKYLGVSSLRPYIDLESVLEGMVPFRLPEVDGLERNVKGITTDVLVEIWTGFVKALEASVDPVRKKHGTAPSLTERQTQMAIRASMLLSSCAKVGLDALIDEATGYQYERARDALEVKLRAYLETEMRKWEKTFPDELWHEFARLTNWKGSVTQRPKYWGKLATKYIYEYLDRDVADWLKQNHPSPSSNGEYWHLALNKPFGIRKLLEHIFMVIGVSKMCKNLAEFDYAMELNFGKTPITKMFDFGKDQP